MDYKKMFDKQLIGLEIDGENEEQVFEQVAEHLKNLGFVNEGYLKGITSREKKFPTGLITQHLILPYRIQIQSMWRNHLFILRD